MLKFLNTMKTNYEKFQVRGAIKEIMRNYGLRTISLANYYKFLNVEPEIKNVHSIKYDIMNGYIKVHKYKENKNDIRSGEPFDTVDINTYHAVYNAIVKILNSESIIPNKIKRNILVKVSR